MEELPIVTVSCLRRRRRRKILCHLAGCWNDAKLPKYTELCYQFYRQLSLRRTLSEPALTVTRLREVSGL